MFSLSKRILIILVILLVIIFSSIYFFIFRPPKEEPRRIGVLFYQNNPTTLSFFNGFKTGLAKQGYYEAKNLKLFVENMQNASPVDMLAILKKIDQKKVNLLITTGKDLTIATAHTIINKPIIYALVSRPITKDTIKNIIDKEKNLTGVSYFTPYDRTLELGKRVIPNFRKLTLLLPLNSAWPDYELLKEAAAKVNVDLSIKEIPLVNLSEAIVAMHGKTDAIYLPYDMQLIFANRTIRRALLNAQIPAISNNLEYQSCSILSYYAEPETIGEIAGRKAVKIFHGAKIKHLPIELSSYYKLTINLRLLKRCNMNIDEDILSYANEVIQ